MPNIIAFQFMTLHIKMMINALFNGKMYFYDWFLRKSYPLPTHCNIDKCHTLKLINPMAFICTRLNLHFEMMLHSKYKYR